MLGVANNALTRLSRHRINRLDLVPFREGTDADNLFIFEGEEIKGRAYQISGAFAAAISEGDVLRMSDTFPTGVAGRDIDELRIDQGLGNLALLAPEVRAEEAVAEVDRVAFDPFEEGLFVVEGEGCIFYTWLSLVLLQKRGRILVYGW